MQNILGILKKLIFPLLIAFVVILLFGKSMAAPFIVAIVVYFFASGRLKLPGLSGGGDYSLKMS